MLGIIYLIKPSIFSPGTVVDFVDSFQGGALIIYTLITFIRGFFLIPSTPFVVGGALLFPDKLLLVLVVSMLGVLFSASLLYFFSNSLGFDERLEKKNPRKAKQWRALLQKRHATLFVLGWSFFPLVPTDLICYVAGAVKMPFRNLIFGVFVGELVLDVLYIFYGSSLFGVL